MTNVSSVTGGHSPFNLSGKVIVVTGASSGLGAHFVRVLHRAGASVVACARRSDRLADVIARLDNASALSVDLSIEVDRERLITEVLREHGRVDVLVNNAGVSTPSRIENETLEQFSRSMEVNVTAVWHLSKLAGAAMIAAGSGSIVNVASMFGHVAAAPLAQANYVASKSAVVGLTRELGVQWARRGVRVNALCPGFFPSEMTLGALDDERSRSYIEGKTPQGRFGRLEELDGPLLLLCSDASSYMTGTSVMVDGGWSAS